MELGGSYLKALWFLVRQEKQLAKDPVHRQMFNSFMKEYIELGHMTELGKEVHGDNTG
jgi:hypothetical protein